MHTRPIKTPSIPPIHNFLVEVWGRKGKLGWGMGYAGVSTTGRCSFVASSVGRCRPISPAIEVITMKHLRRGRAGFNPTITRASTRTFTPAFTLVELLVVIAIIMVLIAMLLPALNKARQQANTTACLSNLRQMGIGVEYYLQDFKNVMPLQYACNTAPNPVAYSDNIGDLLANSTTYSGIYGEPYTVLAYLDTYYLHQPALFICPAVDIDNFDGGAQPLSSSYPYDYFRSDYGIAGFDCSPAPWAAPAGPAPSGARGGACFSYAYPWPLGGTTFYDTWIKVTMIQDPSQRLMIADKGGQLFGPGNGPTAGGQNEFIDIRRGNAGFQFSPGGVDNSARHGGIMPTFANPNTNAKVNFVCVDGHAETDTYADVQMPTVLDGSNNSPYLWLGPQSP
jgi:hypothetical protein